ncbi:MAG TPA: hypothetical protein VFI72_05310 [Candidatus Angelobacter sp.]|nr:hypothetical protein [Candidatus Angelobacter sp.]
MRATREQRQSIRPGFQRPRAEDGGKFGRHSRPRLGHNKMFPPGIPVPETGIYEVIHDRGHRAAHEVVMHGGDLFPPCDQCDQRVRFKLIRTAPYIFDDEDFVEEQ